MTKRLVLLTAGLWSALFVSATPSSRGVRPSPPMSMVDSPWGIWALTTLCAAIAVWLVGRWRDLTGRRLVVTALVTLAAVIAAWFVTEAVVLFTPVVGILPQSGEIASLALYFVFAVEAVAISWWFAGSVAWVGRTPNKGIERTAKGRLTRAVIDRRSCLAR